MVVDAVVLRGIKSSVPKDIFSFTGNPFRPLVTACTRALMAGSR